MDRIDELKEQGLEKYRKQIDETIANRIAVSKQTISRLSGTKIITECACPMCGSMHLQNIEKEFIDEKNTWKCSGHLVIMCNDCMKSNNDGLISDWN